MRGGERVVVGEEAHSDRSESRGEGRAETEVHRGGLSHEAESSMRPRGAAALA